MPTYVMLYKSTDQGAQRIKETVERAEQTRKEQEARGFKVQGLFWTQGEFDLVAVVEAPDEQALMAGVLNINAAGNVRSQVLRAYSAEEMQQIIQKM